MKMNFVGKKIVSLSLAPSRSPFRSHFYFVAILSSFLFCVYANDNVVTMPARKRVNLVKIYYIANVDVIAAGDLLFIIVT